MATIMAVPTTEICFGILQKYFRLNIKGIIISIILKGRYSELLGRNTKTEAGLGERKEGRRTNRGERGRRREKNLMESRQETL